jgi:hypothetical protein
MDRAGPAAFATSSVRLDATPGPAMLHVTGHRFANGSRTGRDAVRLGGTGPVAPTTSRRG